MRDIILACVGGIIALAGGVYLARLLYYKKFGVIAKAEVTDVAAVEKRAGVFSYIIVTAKRISHYTHTLSYEVNGKVYQEKDGAAYTQPLKIGSTHLILCDPRDPKKFKFEADVSRHITIAAVLVVMALIFMARFLLLK
ncbi:hypothetical protein [Ruminococcus sp.]|uniref:hypothetical protein n=1 Tax=Ruminococcus sp. TaxID=41978 RepID=UPI002BEBA2FC|nr:hypothetical protein [Ruminococcus sp.]HOA00664.1 hypothetical protein [Ruminococcus sp.]HOH86283.1 hypothetical protein [Ruminococcus sp.]